MPARPTIVVIGCGRLGTFHARCADRLGCFTLLGVCDARMDIAERVADELSVSTFASPEAVAEASPDAVIVATPTQRHFEVATALVGRVRSILVEKPLTATVAQAEALVSACVTAGTVLLCGHIERMNPAWRVGRPLLQRPRFIEAHRIAKYTPRGADVAVTLDLMIHDLDLLLQVAGESPTHVDAVGVAVVSPTLDLVNARLSFASGLVANLTASRLSAKAMRRFRAFTPGQYVSVDMGERKVEIAQVSPAGHLPERLAPLPGLELPAGLELGLGALHVPSDDAMEGEHLGLFEALEGRPHEVCTGAEALEVLRLADRITAACASPR